MWPEMNTTRPVFTGCEYGRIAAGAFGVEMICLFILEGLLGQPSGPAP
jgi:hypothetical protein